MTVFPRRVIDAAIDAAIGAPLLPTVRAERCVRSHGDETCRACEFACPHHAAWIDSGGAWRLDVGRCDGCGACATACPSQALDAPGVDAAALLRAWSAGERVTLACARNGAAATVRVPCLAGLHPERLATLLLLFPDTPVVLDLSACGECPSGALAPTIAADAHRARDVARVAGAVVDVRVARTAEAASDQVLDRRAFFRVARERTITFVATRLVDGDAGRTTEALPHREALLAAVRRRLHGSTEPPPLQPVPGAFFVDWDVAEACDGCTGTARPACVRACPSRAWRVAGAGSETTLTHDVAACSGCGACQRACPRDALTARAAPIAADAGRLAKRRVSRPRCLVCRQANAAGSDGLCRHCRSRRAMAGRGLSPG